MAYLEERHHVSAYRHEFMDRKPRVAVFHVRPGGERGGLSPHTDMRTGRGKVDVGWSLVDTYPRLY